MATKTAKSLTKTEIFNLISLSTGLKRKEVNGVFDELTNLVKREIKKGSGIFTLPGLLKIKRKIRPATKERPGRNPKTGEPMIIKAKPARTVVRAYPLKFLKELVK